MWQGVAGVSLAADGEVQDEMEDSGEEQPIRCVIVFNSRVSRVHTTTFVWKVVLSILYHWNEAWPSSPKYVKLEYDIVRTEFNE